MLPDNDEHEQTLSEEIFPRDALPLYYSRIVPLDGPRLAIADSNYHYANKDRFDTPGETAVPLKAPEEGGAVESAGVTASKAPASAPTVVQVSPTST